MSADAEHLRLIAYHMRQAGFEYHAEFLERMSHRIEHSDSLLRESLRYSATGDKGPFKSKVREFLKHE